ncbi:ABC transporter [Fusarium pseudoanthophilum]|uniref:ABC transporter n=1 Tax=Fusarium pseudoanthophilum TaxID=48495 RepID=A0A8H5KGM5_9HYPO|nr:ABC transporter [Fusarium pseudoanthophilum]
MRLLSLSLTFLLAANAAAYDNLLRFSPTTEVETRSIDQIYKAALKEGGIVTAWFGGDEKNQNDAIKNAFETAFPGMKLDLTVDLSKYLDGNVDQQLANNNVYIDTITLQTTQDFPRWKEEGALLNYAPAGFDKIYSGLKDSDAAYYGYMGIAWQLVWNADKLKGKRFPAEYSDFLAPEYKGRLALTYPNDDDSILFLFDRILKQYGESWFNKLLQQNPRWTRRAATPQTLIRDPKTPYVATFTSLIGLSTGAGSLNGTLPKKSNFMSWAQQTVILKDAPHPKGAKLLQNFLLSKDFQKANGFWPVRSDVAPPAGFPELIDQPNTDPPDFIEFMADRERVERLRFWFEKRLGTPQGLSSLDDNL